jgi:hypothetical protein
MVEVGEVGRWPGPTLACRRLVASPVYVGFTGRIFVDVKARERRQRTL